MPTRDRARVPLWTPSGPVGATTGPGTQSYTSEIPMSDHDNEPAGQQPGEHPTDSTDGGISGNDAVGPDAPGEQAPGAGGVFTRQRVSFAVAGVAVLGLLGWLVFGNSGDPEPTPTTTSTTTTTEATTTSVVTETRPALVSQVATAKPDLTEVVVLEEPPPQWDSATEIVKWDVPEVPFSQAEFADRPDLPREDYPLQGRYRTPIGWTFTNPTAFGDPFSVVVTEQRGDWAQVMVPVRPNGTLGYTDLSQYDLSEHEYRVELRISDRHLVAYRGTEQIVDTQVVVGRDATRTPTGRFYVTDKTDEANPNGFYGPHVLPLNAYSEQLDTFDGGVPVIAMHGTSRPDLLGQAASNGCIRLPNEVISQLNAELPIGTQVEIYA